MIIDLQLINTYLSSVTAIQDKTLRFYLNLQLSYYNQQSIFILIVVIVVANDPAG